MIQLSERELNAIREHGARDFPEECVGVLLGDVAADEKRVREARPLANTFPEQGLGGGFQGPGKERRYLIAGEEMLALLKEERSTGKRVLGFYHSHPDHPALPSEFDREWAAPWYSYMILEVREGAPEVLTSWRLDENGDQFLPEEIRIVEE